MSRCPECDHPLPIHREQLGARCPHCHDPLYEPPGRFGRTVRLGETACALHPENEAQGPCQQCGKPVCEICRCVWQREIICTVCAESRLERGEDPNDPLRVPRGQAWLSLLFGALAWGLEAGGVGLAYSIGQTTGPFSLFLLFVTFALFGLAIALGVSALGQGMAALLVRGGHDWPATGGLILGGTFLGCVIGLLGLGAWLAN